MHNGILFAKSHPRLSLFDHLKDVRDAGEATMETIGGDLEEAIPGVTVGLARLLNLACWLHDLLKATTAFQQMIDRTGKIAQPIRHEVLAAVLMGTDGPLRDWHRKAVPQEVDRWAMVWAVAGHHLKMAKPARDPRGDLIRDYGPFTALLGASEVKAALEQAAHGVALGEIDDLSFDTIEEDEPGCLRDRAGEYVRNSVSAWGRFKRDPRTMARVALLKGLLIAADVGGSAAPEKQVGVAEWTRTALRLRLAPTDLKDVIQKGTKGKKPLPFQEAVGASEKQVTLVAAGCGNGKTTAAYLWARKHAAGKKLFFTYPTTGTATAGYAGYLADQHALLADLIHMRAGVDLESIHGTPRDEPGENESAVRIESLRVWDRKVVVCTVDTVLGVLQCQRRSMYSLPAFLAGAMVFDEVHSYDRRLFGGLLRFLKEFPGIPTLIMSASIPPGRLKRLKGVLGDRAGEIIKGDPELEGHKRYRLEPRDAVEACWKDVEEALTAGKKVLWVCNTVGDAIQVARQARDRDGVTRTGVKTIVYHSRFRYKDRVQRQEKVLQEFAYQAGRRVKPGPSLVIATQVCEMSLDISADLLVTAECPLPALVQRLGRLNRYATRDDSWPCLVYPFCGLPYNEDAAGVDLYGDHRQAMAATRDVVKALAEKPCSQRNLADRLDLLEDDEEPETYSALFDGGWVTESMPVRDGDQSSTVIRELDLDEIAASEKLGPDRSKWPAAKLMSWTIPMNHRRGLTFDGSAGPYPVAGKDILDYSIEKGGEWVKK